MAAEPRLCFVIMPFSDTTSVAAEEWTDFFNNVLKPAVEGCGLGYECRRASTPRGSIIKDVIEDLRGAHVVIADITDNNPNVFYELAARHTISPRTILITRHLDGVPFDLRGYASPEYSVKTEAARNEFRDMIASALADVERHPDKHDNPISDFLHNATLSHIRMWAAGATGTVLSGSVPEHGFGLFVFGGGTSDDLLAATGCPHDSSAFFATDANGQWLVYIPGTVVTAINEPWMARFPGGIIPPGTALIGKAR